MRGEFTEQEVSEFMEIVKMQVRSFEERRKKVKKVTKITAAEFLIQRLPFYEKDKEIWDGIIKKLSVKQILFIGSYVIGPG